MEWQYGCNECATLLSCHGLQWWEAFMQLEAQRQPSPDFFGRFFHLFFWSKSAWRQFRLCWNWRCDDFLYMVVLSFGYSYPFIWFTVYFLKRPNFWYMLIPPPCSLTEGNIHSEIPLRVWNGIISKEETISKLNTYGCSRMVYAPWNKRRSVSKPWFFWVHVRFRGCGVEYISSFNSQQDCATTFSW